MEAGDVAVNTYAQSLIYNIYPLNENTRVNVTVTVHKVIGNNQWRYGVRI